jgi:uncharacterized protein (DUF1684 family)
MTHSAEDFTPVVPAWAGPEEEAWAAWRGKRLASLHEPYGWLALASYEWLPAAPGPLASAPGVWWSETTGDALVAHWNDARFELAEDESDIVGSFNAADHPFDAKTRDGSPRRIAEGRVDIELGRRDGRYMIRTRLSTPEAVRIPTYPYDPSWVVTGAVELARPYDEAVASIRPDAFLHRTIVGTVRFLLPNHPEEIVASIEDDGRRPHSQHAYTLTFSDKTSGKTTPLWRFVPVLADQPEENDDAGPFNAVIDFNRALNYPMAFSSYAVCAAPVAGNAIPAPITAGEQAVDQAAR